jgi:hypothetical protein
LDTVDGIFTSLSVDTIEEMFRNWIHRLEQMIELNGNSIRERFSDTDNMVMVMVRECCDD